MKKLSYSLLILLLIGTLTACSGKKADTQDSHGNAISLSNYQGKWVVINYWATWCKPCLTEMPALQQLYQQHKKHLVVLGVSYDKLGNAKMNQVAKKYALTYPLVSQFPIKKLGIKTVSILPITFIINPQGKLVKTLKGPQTKTQFVQAIGIKQHG